ncbi:MAG: sugar transferase [Candidatus Eremiobacteraeota bacterium]|nr:sugar transferase [Candidatus Eremiobacteraeota bacterium]
MIVATTAATVAAARLLEPAQPDVARRSRWLSVARDVPTAWLVAKRALDIILSCGLLIVLAPLFALIAIGIKFSSPGPVLFSQMRVGKGGREFRFYKFRTMVDGAHLMHEEVLHLNELDGPALKIADDPRVHDFGTLLRRTSLDELPQLYNVLCGQMSLVGPRPALPREVQDYEPHYLQRFAVLPGITGLWQVSGRANVPFRRWMAMDIWYARRWTPLLDLWILARTVPAVFRGEGAW